MYGIFALSATARAAVQIATKFDEAPVAYLLSAFAAVVYVCATVGLARSGPGARRLAVGAVTVELIGVLVVGTISLAQPDDFPDATVWSGYGAGLRLRPARPAGPGAALAAAHPGADVIDGLAYAVIAVSLVVGFGIIGLALADRRPLTLLAYGLVTVEAAALFQAVGDRAGGRGERPARSRPSSGTR